MDLRGYGASDKTPRGYDLPNAAADVSGVIRSLGATSAVLVGHGWGGYVAWSAAVFAQRHVRALATLSAPHPLVLGAFDRHRLLSLAPLAWFQLPIIPERRLLARSGAYVEELLRAWSASPVFPDAESRRRYRTALQVWPAPHCALEYQRWFVRSRFRADGRAYSARMRRAIPQPVLEVFGAADPLLPVPTKTPPTLADRVRREVLAGVGHFPHEEAPDRVTGLLLDWLATIG